MDMYSGSQDMFSQDLGFLASPEFSDEFVEALGGEVDPDILARTLMTETGNIDVKGLGNNSSSFGIDGWLDSQGSLKLELDQLNPTVGLLMPPSQGPSKLSGKYVLGPVTKREKITAPKWDDIEKLVFDKETVVLEDWRGLFDFKVRPNLEKDQNKKVLYDVAQNKLYCDTKPVIPFKVEMDFEKARQRENLMIKTYLAYDDEDVRNKAVLRCSLHLEQEKNLYKDDDDQERCAHMLRPANGTNDMKYFQHPISKRCYIVWPSTLPEAGLQYVTRSFCFTCRNSCTIPGIDGKARRQISMLFVLFDGCTGEVLGRNRTTVRVCSAPLRDYNKDVQNAGGNVISRKRKSNDLTVDVGVLASPKLCLLSPDISNSPTTSKAISDAAGPSIHLPLTVRNVLKAAKQEDDMTSSQETVYSCEESAKRIHLRDFVREVRWALKQKQSDNPQLRLYSSHVFGAVKMAMDLCQAARQLDESSHRVSGNDQSPDLGYQQD